jgi:hypothetical protein
MRQHTTGRARVGFLANRIKDYEDALLDAVCASREAGATWEQIGQVLGITAQAAHSRYSATCKRVMETGGPTTKLARW